MIDQKPIGGGGSLPGHGGVRVGEFEELPVETEGVIPLARVFGGFGGVEKELGGFGGVRGEPGAGGGEGLGGTLFGEPGFEEIGDGGFVLRGGGFERGDAVVEGGGLGEG